jgi:acyl-CoA thioester hydrolase
MKNFFELKLRIDWAELDLFGHVNNVMFMKYVQSARVNIWEQTGLYQDFLNTKRGPMLASVKCDFKKPLFYPGDVIIRSRMEFTGNTSFGLIHELFNHENELVATAQDVLVYFDFNINQKLSFPQQFKLI